jgi:hypothetical protein
MTTPKAAEVVARRRSNRYARDVSQQLATPLDQHRVPRTVLEVTDSDLARDSANGHGLSRRQQRRCRLHLEVLTTSTRLKSNPGLLSRDSTSVFIRSQSF